MEKLRIHVCGTDIHVTELGKLTTGMVGATASFSFSPEWNGLLKTAVFCSGIKKDVILTGDTAKIPPECIRTPALTVGVYGHLADGTVVIPTVMSGNIGVSIGTKPSGDAQSGFTPDKWMQMLGMIGDLSMLTTDDKANLVAAINEAARKGGGAVDPAEIQRIVTEYLAANPPTVTETDPTVPAWAKQPTKPSYTAEEVGAQPKGNYVKTVNGVAPDESGNVEVDIPEGGGNVGCLLTFETITIGEEPGEPESIPVTGLGLDLTSYSAKVGDGFYINPVVKPSNATNRAVTWKSNAPSIATVDGNGYVTCKAEGNAVITCTTVDGGFTATCAVSVAAESSDEPEPEVTLSSISATYSGGDVAVGTAVTDLTGIVVTAHYSDGSTATVTDYTLSGTIAEGSNTIAVSYGGKTTTFTVTGVAESGGTTGGKIQYSTLNLTAGGFKADGTTHTLGSTYHVTIPYSEGMYIRTLYGSWAVTTYPAIIVVTDGVYSLPTYNNKVADENGNTAITIGGKIGNHVDATLTGYSAGSTVIVQMLTGSTAAEDMDDSDWLYYIPGGEA